VGNRLTVSEALFGHRPLERPCCEVGLIDAPVTPPHLRWPSHRFRVDPLQPRDCMGLTATGT